jgi:polyhydroxyalkanoate synthesis regulator phasin
MLRSRKTLIGVAVVALVAVVGAVGFAAWSVGTTLAAPLFQGTQPPNAAAAGQYATFFLEHFASHLGLTTDQVKSAYTSAYNDTIDQMVKDGKLTQAEADAMKQKISQGVANGNLPMFGPGFRGKGGIGMGGGMGFSMGRGGMMDLGPAEFAKALGMTQQDLMTELQAGKSIADVAKEKNIDLNKVKQTILADFKAQLDAAVKSGKITQAQADRTYQNFSQKLDAMVNQAGMMGKFHGKFPGKPQGTPQGTPSTPNPTN